MKLQNFSLALLFVGLCLLLGYLAGMQAAPASRVTKLVTDVAQAKCNPNEGFADIVRHDNGQLANTMTATVKCRNGAVFPDLTFSTKNGEAFK